MDIIYGEGISREGDILDLAANENIVNKSGAWYAYNGSKIGQGRENAKIYLKEHPDAMAEIEQKVRDKFIKKDDEEEKEEDKKTDFSGAGMESISTMETDVSMPAIAEKEDEE